MVDVTLLPENAFGYVPTPALVAPIEFTMRREDYEALGGHMKHVMPLAEARAGKKAIQNDHILAQVTPMAAVAGAVADEMLAAMLETADVRRAYVNNGGDIALHLADDERFSIASANGHVSVAAGDGVGGIATSGRHGRSHSLGIADSVSVLAHSGAAADVAATLIANAVDLPGSPKVKRVAACELSPDSDLRERLVTVDVLPLEDAETSDALARGLEKATSFQRRGLIIAATLGLNDKVLELQPAASIEGAAVHA
jgi:ApbE superfamily uncharacterized protein (UPF0280 family)